MIEWVSSSALKVKLVGSTCIPKEDKTRDCLTCTELKITACSSILSFWFNLLWYIIDSKICSHDISYTWHKGCHKIYHPSSFLFYPTLNGPVKVWKPVEILQKMGYISIYFISYCRTHLRGFEPTEKNHFDTVKRNHGCFFLKRQRQ